MSRLVEISISLAVIVLVSWIGERFPSLSGILATMPLTIPLTMIIVFRHSGGDLETTAQFAGGAVGGIVATGAFVLASWLALRRRWPFPGALAGGYAAWGGTLLLWHLLKRWLSLGG